MLREEGTALRLLPQAAALTAPSAPSHRQGGEWGRGSGVNCLRIPKYPRCLGWGATCTVSLSTTKRRQHSPLNPARDPGGDTQTGKRMIRWLCASPSLCILSPDRQTILYYSSCLSSSNEHGSRDPSDYRRGDIVHLATRVKPARLVAPAPYDDGYVPPHKPRPRDPTSDCFPCSDCFPPQIVH